MEEEQTNTAPELINTKKKQSSFQSKVFLIGLPIFIVQLVAVYFITADILMPEMYSAELKKAQDNNINVTSTKSGDPKNEKTIINETNAVIFSVDDMIVNPAQTNGKILLLASLGVSVDSEEARKALEEKQVILKDAILSVLSSKNVMQLSSSSYRDTLKTEILHNISAKMPESKINNIYFSKFIIQ